MTQRKFEEIRDKDHLVLQHIKKGLNDTQKITAETTLENHHVSYCFEKLEELGLITVEKPDTMIERIVDGQKRVFQHPKQAELTEKGLQYLENSDSEKVTEYEDLSHGELVEKVKAVEEDVKELEEAFKLFKKQIQNKL